MKNVQFNRQRRYAETALKNKWQNKSHGSFYCCRKPETAEQQNPQITSGVSDVPPWRLAPALSRLDVRWWRSNKAVWQLLSFFSSCLEPTLRGTNEKLAGEQKRSHHTAATAQRARCFFWHGADGSAQVAPGKCHISTPRMEVSPIGYHPTLRSRPRRDLITSFWRQKCSCNVNMEDHTYSSHTGSCAWWPVGTDTRACSSVSSQSSDCNLLSLPFNC